MRTVALTLFAAGLLAACSNHASPALRVDTTVTVRPSEAAIDSASDLRVQPGVGLPARPRPAPSISLPTRDGDTLRLDDYQGRAVLVDFFTSWCAPCRQETDDLAALHEARTDSGLSVVRVAVDERRAGNESSYFKHYAPPYPVAFAGRREANLFGGVYSLPTSFLISPDGVVVQRLVGPVRADSLRDALFSETSP